MQRAILSVLALALAPSSAVAQTAETGRALAERWCMGCHVVEPVLPAPGEPVASFATIAARPGTTAASLALYLSSGHTRMPDFDLKRGERDALISYILSLR